MAVPIGNFFRVNPINNLPDLDRRFVPSFGQAVFPERTDAPEMMGMGAFYRDWALRLFLGNLRKVLGYLGLLLNPEAADFEKMKREQPSQY